MRLHVLTAAFLILIFGCDGELDDLKLERNIDAPIQTDTLEYTLRYNNDMLELEIPQVFTNLREDTIYITNCNEHFDVRLQKQSDEEWIDAYSPVLPDCLSPPIEIAPQSNYRDTLQVMAGSSSTNVYPRFQVDEIEGVYRLVWINVLESFNPDKYPFGSQIPLEQRVSNRFKLQAE